MRRIDKEFLAKRELITPNRTCEVLGIDEIAIRKGHVYATVLGDALEELRRSEYNRQADKVMDFDLKRGRFLLLKSNVHLDDRGRAWIARLKETNDDVYTAYLLKEQAIAFYEQKSKGEAEDYLKKWASACIASGLKPFVQLGKRLLRHAKSILEYFIHRVSNGFAEGINNKIKVIKRMAFGFHDFEYFRLKILSVTGYLRPYPRVRAF